MRKIAVLAAFIASVFAPMGIAGENMGEYVWEIEPFGDQVCFNVEKCGPYYSLNGVYVGVTTYACTGTAVLVGSEVHMIFTLYVDPINTAWTFGAQFDQNTLSGTWSDTTAASGDFTYQGPGPLAVTASDESGDIMSSRFIN